MVIKPKKLLGLKFTDFQEKVSSGKEIHLQRARLIPFYKPGDEMALTSIFLSSLKLVDPYRKNIFKTINLSSYGKVHIFTEVEFVLFDKKRIDGLIIIERGKKIVDACVIEVKNKSNELKEEQLKAYVNICKSYGIPKIVTISNQFVNFPTQSPINLKTPKSVKAYHLSWTYLLTVAHIFLIDNETNIQDDDQFNILKEVLRYFETQKSGIVGFHQMKPGWIEISQKINSGASIKLKDLAVDETVSSWLEEEQDMALKLSRELGLLVLSGHKKFKNDLNGRINFEKRKLVKERNLDSILSVNGAVSDISIIANFGRKNIEMSVDVQPPTDRSVRPQITWLNNQLKGCFKKNSNTNEHLKSNLMVDINIKFTRKPVRVLLEELDTAYEKLKGKEIKSFSVVYVNYLGKKFESRKMFVIAIEEMLVSYYEDIVQYLKNWKKPAPKVKPLEDEI
tara:strand:- start:296 stop:1648 length:1353 start_codon:yes stop_codon:yes gene_type:complete